MICTRKFVVCMQIFQSASLCLTTTTPEQLASALWWFMIPLKHIGVPVPEIILTLLLSLRFINLVFDEASIYGNHQSTFSFCLEICSAIGDLTLEYDIVRISN
jgi:energy-coupling factor transporter transmembrane protein EcfT